MKVKTVADFCPHGFLITKGSSLGKCSLCTGRITRRPWSDQDVRELRRLRGDGLMPAEISRRLGRSASAVSRAIARYLP